MNEWVPFVKCVSSTFLSWDAFKILQNINNIDHFVANHFIEIALCMSIFYDIKDSLRKNEVFKFIFVDEIGSCEVASILHHFTYFNSRSIEAEN